MGWPASGGGARRVAPWLAVGCARVRWPAVGLRNRVAAGRARARGSRLAAGLIGALRERDGSAQLADAAKTAPRLPASGRVWLAVAPSGYGARHGGGRLGAEQ